MPTLLPYARRFLTIATAVCLLSSAANLAYGQQAAGPRAAGQGPAVLPPPANRNPPQVAPRRLPPDARSATAAESVATEKESRYLIERVDPERTLDVVTGRPTVLRFRVPPFRDQVNNNPNQPPSLSTRSFTSTVELRNGESLALAGLIRNAGQ